MSGLPPSTYLTADKQRQITAIKFKEAAPTMPGPEPLKPASCHQQFGEMKGYLASKELEPPR